MAEHAEKTKKTPEFRVGDSVRVSIKVVEGDSERVQAFEGTVLLRRGMGLSENFTVRKVSFGVGVERTFPLNSPLIDRIEVVRSGRARRARLYYLRGLKGKAARLNETDRSSEGETVKSATPKESPKSVAPSAQHKGNGTETPRATSQAPQPLGTSK